MKSFDSLCAHDVEDPRTVEPHVLPLYLTSSYDYESIDHQVEVFNKQKNAHVYSRYANPTVQAVADKIAAMEAFGTELEPAGLMFSSGMSAIYTVIMSELRHGDKILTQGNLYGGTTELLLKVCGRSGIDVVFTDLTDIDGVKQSLKDDPSIRMIYFETPTNPTLECVDIGALCDAARENDCVTAIDNTFCTPYLQRPLTFGVDYVIHSTTKFLNGHGNSIAGAVVGRNAEVMKTKVWETMKLIGTNPGPMDAWLVHQGMKTLTVRMDRHCSNAMSLAQYLESHPKVNYVNYVGLASHKYHQLATQQMSGYGGMLSFEVKGGADGALQFLRNVSFCSLAPTLGDVDTLLLHPVTSSHLNVSEELRKANGITPGLVRVSVGIEGIQDIIGDFDRGLSAVR